MTVRDLARTLSPGAGEELAPLLRNIAVSNNRIANAPRWHNDPRSVRSAAAEFV